MNQLEAKNLIQSTFQNQFDEHRFRNFAKNLFNDIDESKAFSHQGQDIPDAYKDHICQLKRIGKYTDPEGSELDILIVRLKKESALDRARTMQRNFIADYLKKRGEKDAAIVAYHTDGLDDWRFSYVRMDYRAEQDESGKVRVKTDLTPARRYSFLVGKYEPNHTAQQQLLPILQDDQNNPTLAEIEKAFNIESITKEFFERYKNLFLRVKEELDELVVKDSKIREDFATKCINTADFAKKLLGQIVFLYFLQKKGWLGVEKDSSGNFKGWGTGPKDFLQRLHRKDIVPYENFFNDLLEPLFYEALAIDRGEDSYYSPFKCKIPFLNGGLFEPISGYNWQETDILIRNETIGDVFSTFDQYNFTVREDEPLEKEVAVDPEMLGKVFENLLEVKDRKSKGTFYTPREIVHYMCQESLVNYLNGTLNANSIGYERLGRKQTVLFGPEENVKPDGQMELMAKTGPTPIPREDIELFIRQGEFGIENDLAKEQGTKSYAYKLPESIRANAGRIDEALSDIKICDPAIGSGAFPVGMLHEIVSARKTLNVYLEKNLERTLYNFKRHAIQQSIYGVDIDCGAVDIAKLRLWLSLVVDEDDFQTIKPLPNLDYKIVCGNSLFKVERNLLNHHLFAELEALKLRYFDEINPRQKKDEKAHIEELIRQLTNNDEHFDYEIYFSEVFHKKYGFDIVIGNPPYGVAIPNNELKQHFKNYPMAKKVPDSYCFFVEMSFNILRPNGNLALIIPNTFCDLENGESFRKYLLEEKQLLQIWQSGWAFKSAVVDTLVFLASNTKPNGDSTINISVDGRIYTRPLADFLSNRLAKIDYRNQPGKNDLPHKIDLQSIQLNSIADVKAGVKMYEKGKGSPPQTDKIVADRPYSVVGESPQGWKPLYRGTDVTRYSLKKPKEFVNYGPWIAAPRRPELFQSPKILMRRTDDRLMCAIERDSAICVNSCHVIKLKPGIKKFSYEFLTGVLNSRLIQYFFELSNPQMCGKVFAEIKVVYVEHLPIFVATENQQKPIIERVQKILANPNDPAVSQLEAEIDQLVYDLYGLTKEEISLVEGKK